MSLPSPKVSEIFAKTFVAKSIHRQKVKLNSINTCIKQIVTINILEYVKAKQIKKKIKEKQEEQLLFFHKYNKLHLKLLFINSVTINFVFLINFR